MKLNLFQPLGLLAVLCICLVAVCQTCDAHDKSDTWKFEKIKTIEQIDSLWRAQDSIILARLRLDSLERAFGAKVKK